MTSAAETKSEFNKSAEPFDSCFGCEEIRFNQETLKWSCKVLRSFQYPCFVRTLAVRRAAEGDV